MEHLDMEKECMKVLAELKSSHSKVRYGALILLRTTLIKSKEAVNYLVQGGCNATLVQILRDGTSQTQVSKTVDIILSIIANLCLEEDVREKVVSCNGIDAIAEVIMESEQESIHNRGVRAISNLAQHPANCDAIFKLKIPAFVAKKLMETEDKECISTYLRSIRILGHSNENIKKLAEGSMALSAVASVLKKDDKKLIQKSLRILNDMTSLRCCAAFAEEVLAANVLEELVILAEDSDKHTAFISFSIILRLTDHGNLRQSLGNAGAIGLFMREMRNVESKLNLVSVLNALCLCSREAGNRPKLHNAEVLDLFMSHLSIDKKHEPRQTDFSVLHDRLISSLVNFLHEDNWILKLLDLNLMPILLNHLQRVTSFEIINEDLVEETRILASLMGKDITEGMEVEDESRIPVDEHKACLDEGQIKITDGENGSMVEENNVIEASTEKEQRKESDDSESPDLIDKQVSDRFPTNELDDEVRGIVSSPESCQATGSKSHTFSINSPTYQLEESSWRNNNFSSGVTCKSFGSDCAATNGSPLHTSELSSASLEQQAPYSPFSGGASYYSPAYSPTYSAGSSPKYSPNPYASSVTTRCQGSSQASPAWSLASSDRLSPVDHNRLYGSPNDLPGDSPFSSSNLQAPLSPLSITFPMSPPQVSFSEDPEPQSPVFNSQMSLSSQHEQNSVVSESSQENVSVISSSIRLHEESPFPRGASHEQYKFSVVPLSQEELIYSASEEDDAEEEDEEEKDDKKSFSMKSDHKNTVDLSRLTVSPRNSPKSSFLELTSAAQLGHQKVVNLKRSLSSPSSSTGSELITGLKKDHGGGNSQKKIKFDSSTPRSVEEVCKENRSAVSVRSENECFFDFFQQEGAGKKSSVVKVKGKGLISHPFYKDWWKQPMRSAGNSPQRTSHFPLGSFSPTPSSSPHSRHGLSPFASPRPFRSPYHGETDIVKASQSFYLMPDQSQSKTSVRDTSESASSARQSSRQQNQTSSNAGAAIIPPTTSNLRGNERLKNILRTSESNIMILLSRVSIQNNPTQSLVQSQVFRTLLCYLSSAPSPLERCFRLLNRVCSNPLCLQPLLLIQGPAFIVRCLIQNPDGSFPAILFTPDAGDHHSGQRGRINLDHIIPSSQNSIDTVGSQASEFGQRMEFEFGSDAYSMMMTSRPSPGNLFRRHPSLSLESQSAQDGSAAHGGLAYRADCNRKKVRIQMGMRLLRAMSSLALSRYGDGEVKHILARGSDQDKLQCVVSLLHLLIACGSFSRHQLLSKTSFDQVIPLLFTAEAPQARASIITAISLYAHVNSVSKRTEQKSEFIRCPYVTGVAATAKENGNMKNLDTKTKTAQQNPLNGMKDATSEIVGVDTNSKRCCHSKQEDKGHSGRLSTVTSLQAGDGSACRYSALTPSFDLSLVVVNESSRGLFRAHRETIMKKSAYFSSMLGGGYEEAGKEEIILQNLSIPGFEYVIHYLHGCVSGCPVIDGIPLEIKRVESVNMATGNADSSKSNAACSANLITGGSGNECSSSVGQSLNRLPRSNSNDTPRHTPKVSELEAKEEDEGSASQEVNRNIPAENSANSPRVPDSSESAEVNETSSNNNSEEVYYRKVDSVIDKCEEVLSLADQFVLSELVDYVACVLSHACLFPHTCEFIFGLACFYNLSDLIFDCVVEMVLSTVPRSEVSAFILKMGLCGYRGQVETVLQHITGPL